MLPLTDTIRPRRLPFATAGLIAANVAVWVAYQLPAGVDQSVREVGFRACQLAGNCAENTQSPILTALGSTFSHGSWSHLVGNMVFLAAFGIRVEDELGRLRYLLLYGLSGLGALLLEAGLVLAFAPGEADIPGIGASGAISGVLGAYMVLAPFQRMLTWFMPVFFFRIPALGLLFAWFALQVLEGTYGLSHPGEFVGVAFFAHVGGFLAGALVATLFTSTAWTRSHPFHGHGRHPPPSAA
jgi:membrane associated rhomboid family serine protease